jgi:hypothetical protein
MSEGTSLEDLEAGGDISAAADEAKMAEIMREINTPDGGSGGGMPPMGGVMQPRAPMMMAPPPQPRYQQHYVEVEDDGGEYTKPLRRGAPKKKNMWSSIVEKLRDPLLVAILVFVVSLPVLHTLVAKYAGWAFAVGGQLSWLGLIALSLASGVLFGILQGAANLLGL